MEYRDLGKTGKKVSVIGLGCEHLDGKPYAQVKETIDAALENGVNVLDVFMPGREVRENIARALGSRRKEVLIQGHLGSVDLRQQYDISRDLSTVKRYYEDLLRIYGGYIDLGMLFFIDSEEDFKGVFETPFAEYALTLKEKGDIGHIGFSSHNPRMATRAIQTGIPELMLFSINPAFDLLPAGRNALDELDAGLGAEAFGSFDPERQELYRLCEHSGIGITVMKSLGAGKLISAEHTPFAEPMTVPQCVHYALSRPAVASVLLGCKSRREVEAAMGYLSASEEERDYSGVLGTLSVDFRGNCVYCGHCRPCPAEIDVAVVTKYLDIARLDEERVPPSIRSHYAGLAHHGEECIGCGSCEERCPFGVPIIANMAKAARIFGS